MPYNVKSQKKDSSGYLIPQAFNYYTNQFQPNFISLITVPPTTGAKTVTNVAASIFANTETKANRTSMTVYNESDSNVYWGDNSVTVATGMTLLSGDSVTFNFHPEILVDIYFISSLNKSVRVEEV